MKKKTYFFITFRVKHITLLDTLIFFKQIKQCVYICLTRVLDVKDYEYNRYTRDC